MRALQALFSGCFKAEVGALRAAQLGGAFDTWLTHTRGGARPQDDTRGQQHRVSKREEKATQQRLQHLANSHELKCSLLELRLDARGNPISVGSVLWWVLPAAAIAACVYPRHSDTPTHMGHGSDSHQPSD